MERLTVQSFISHGYEFRLHTYDDVKAPSGTTIVDANTILDISRLFTYKKGFGKGSISGFSDLFRYTLIEQAGGWWTDMDVVLLRPLPEVNYFFAAEATAISHITASCLFRCPPNSKVMQWCLNRFAEFDLDKLQWGQGGPYLLSRAVNAHGLSGHIASPTAVCSIPWWDVGHFQKPFNLSERANAIHLWHQQWLEKGLNPDVVPEGSLYSQLLQQYDIQQLN